MLTTLPQLSGNSSVTAFSILVHTETTMPSGFFLKKKPPCTIFKWQHVSRKRSSGFGSFLVKAESTAD
jgi:hypothetical protein